MKMIKLICIIDDDPICIFAVKKVLELSNICEKFLTFNNGEEALTYLKPLLIGDEKVPDIIFLDINMPIMNGWQFLDEFIKLKLSKVITIYIVSSSVDPTDIEKAKQYKEVSDFIVKPINKISVSRILKEYISKK